MPSETGRRLGQVQVTEGVWPGCGGMERRVGAPEQADSLMARA